MMDKKYNILLVDDEEDNLALLYRTLRGAYNLEKTTSPLHALEILKEKHFELVISDHKMPEMDGVEFLKHVQVHYPSTMRILLTAYSDANILIDAINYAKIYRYVKKPFNPEELQLIVSSALEYYQLKYDNDKLINDLKELFSGTIKAIMEALDAKDSYTSGRSKRITYYSIIVAKQLGLSTIDTGKVELAGMLHDIGMIGVSDEILYKIDALSQEEYDEIKKHITYSVKILEDIKQLKDVVEIIKYHHEKYDGTGYPYGVKGEDIPLGSRIIAVADAFDSIISNRIYRNKIELQDALNEIKKGALTQFDPVVVKAFEDSFDAISAAVSESELSSYKD
ncbi:MAG TPA: response regulator [Candidatus Limenecus avicola]|jgi:response regulator receiver modulated metal dependent phosphohydrolase|uniref:Stage 0 sporulation protein A homolog n=1 Tax=Candidatus Limenecus avicola TaxID=2840847 RepID=A0A9D1N2B4_9CLOT|nr:similar to sigma 54 response regulatory protein [Clostridium sp. CAG:306]HIU93454.1 response regulator [Candidatus Limenecus avicola]